MKRPPATIVAAFAAGLLLTACGSGADPGPGQASGSTDPNPSTSAANSSILIWSDPDHAAALKATAAAHQQTTGVQVIVETIGADADDSTGTGPTTGTPITGTEDLATIRDDLVTLAPQGQGPDLFVGRSEWVGTLADAGLLAPVDLSAQRANFRRVATDGFTSEGRTLGVPFATENLALFRNTDLAPEPPESIDVMARDGLELEDKDKRVLPIALPVGPTGDAYHWYPFYSAGGGRIFGLDSRGGYTADKLEVGKPGSIEAATQLAALTEDGALSPDTTADEALSSFTDGRSPFLIAGPPAVQPVRASGVAFTVESVPGFDGLPGSRSQALVSSLGLMQSAFARNAPGASQYLNSTLMTAATMTALAAPRGLGPAWTEAYTTAAAADPVIKGFGDYADASVPTPNLAEADAVWQRLGRAQLDVMAGAKPSATMQTAGREIQAAIDAG
ncbi:MAG: extracellular solute-binding protein [Candidatus Nanopelagicales bacterium]